VDKIIRATGLTLNKKYYTGDDFSLVNLDNCLADLQCGGDDVIWFVYTGYGDRDIGKGSIWPNLVSQKDYRDFSKVAEALKAKKARLTIVVADCANGEVKYDSSSDGSMQKPSVNAYNELFLKYKGFIRASAAKPGDQAYCDRNEGGLYLTNLFNAMGKYDTWQEIFDNARSNRKNGSNGKQTPQHEVRVTRKS
jgi:hypothetical protein